MSIAGDMSQTLCSSGALCVSNVKRDGDTGKAQAIHESTRMKRQFNAMAQRRREENGKMGE